ncbi:MAG TPA: class I SAM-dependent methyltransferase [Candidatus Acidoferrum sp.]|nr:class I SAM-dependent methyltransferase [Candidatus Acidoferrum sp.]
MSAPRTSQERLDDFSAGALADRHDRQQSLLENTGALGSPPYRVLDLGSGSGVTAVWAARRGWPVTAVDVDGKHMAVLERHLAVEEPGLPIERVVSDAVTCEGVPDAAYDIAYLKDLLEHVDDFRTCLATAYRKLKPGGLLYVATTNVVCPLQLEYHGVGPYSWYPRWLKDRIRLWALAGHPRVVAHSARPALHWFSRRSLSRAMREVGFTRTWDLYDLVRSPGDLTRRTRLIYPLIRHARRVPLGPDLVDLMVVGLTMVAQA